jgi:D-amino-acid oxidase
LASLKCPTGQSVLSSNSCDKVITYHHDDGTSTYLIPRPFNRGTIIGGTREDNNWDPHVSTPVRDSLLRQAAQVYPALVKNGLPPDRGGIHVISDNLGRRPSRRGGPRIERELTANGVVIHAYGFGEFGYKASWGAATEVLRLAGGAVPFARL